MAQNTSIQQSLCQATGRFSRVGQEFETEVDHAIEFVLKRTRQNLTRFGDQLPDATRNGRYFFSKDGGWIGGFWPGMLNLLYEGTGDRSFLDRARESRTPLVNRLSNAPDTLDHDLGFLFTPSAVADYTVSGDPEARDIAFKAASLLAERFNTRGQFLQCWNIWTPPTQFNLENAGRIIIDSMYNIPLLYWAAQESGKEEYSGIATAHARTCLRYLVRDDFSTFHTYVFDPDSGAPRYGQTHQGFADDSFWARGQSWAIGGFSHAYRHSGEEAFREAALACAIAYLREAEEDSIPRWDFRVPDPSTHPLDSSAAAITACGLLEIARNDIDNAPHCLETAKTIVHALWTGYSTRESPEEEGLLTQGCGHYPAGIHLNSSLIYGDYYFTEALMRLKGLSNGYW